MCIGTVMANKIHKIRLYSKNTMTGKLPARKSYDRSTLTVPKDFDKTVKSLLFAPHPTKKKK